MRSALRLGAGPVKWTRYGYGLLGLSFAFAVAACCIAFAGARAVLGVFTAAHFCMYLGIMSIWIGLRRVPWIWILFGAFVLVAYVIVCPVVMSAAEAASRLRDLGK